ncbi:MAG: LysM peptidoglycan-binding domain-containing protein [Akkermansiaceae bacterium]
MKQTILLLSLGAITALAFSSCAQNDPEYAAWKKKKDAEAAAANNPYGAPAAGANPYGVPQTGGETGSYTPAGGTTGAAPYQPLPGVNQPPAAGVPAQPAPPIAGHGGGAGGGVSHTVVSGDSLWGLARKYNTSIEAIQQANGLTGTNIQTGQTLTIPAQ